MNKRLFLTPAGGLLIAICFFLPWIKMSCMGTATYSGAQIGGIYWTLFIAGLLLVGAFYYLRRIKRFNFMPTVVSVISFVSTAVIVYGILTVAGGKRILLFRVGPDDVNLRLQIGAYGTLIGYVLAWAGIAPMIRIRRRKPAQTTPAESSPSEIRESESELHHTST